MKRTSRGKALVAGVAGSLLLAGGIASVRCLFSAPRYDGPVTDHFDGARFVNNPKLAHHTGADFFKWILNRDRGAWDRWTDARPGPPPPPRVAADALRITFVNHATTLIQLGGINILTDPIWSFRCSPVTWAGPRRHRDPGIRFEDLPEIDVVLVSHNHYDHMDVATLERLAREHDPLFIVGLGNAAMLAKHGITNARELDWWQSLETSGARIHSVPSQHFSSRGLCDRDANLWTGFVVDHPQAGRVYFAGDTGMGPHFTQIRERIGAPRLALLPIGAFRPEWFMSPVHISPAQAMKVHADLGAGTTMAIHFGTFPLGDDGQREAPDLLRAAATRAGLAERIWIPEFGEGRDVPPTP
ncbi:MAG: MBL fold metallo-hydrolase [Thermoanaerobaculia bacterium]